MKKKIIPIHNNEAFPHVMDYLLTESSKIDGKASKTINVSSNSSIMIFKKFQFFRKFQTNYFCVVKKTFQDKEY
jgi:hypothetical protein